MQVLYQLLEKNVMLYIFFSRFISVVRELNHVLIFILPLPIDQKLLLVDLLRENIIENSVEH